MNLPRSRAMLRTLFTVLATTAAFTALATQVAGIG